MLDRVTDDGAARQEAQEILAQFRTLRRQFLRAGRAELARSGLTAAQLSVVSLLGARGSMTLTELGRELQLSHSTASGIVDRLQARGVVERSAAAEDRRYTRISLTEDARRADSSHTGEGPIARLEAALASATPDERRTISRGLALLLRLSERG